MNHQEFREMNDSERTLLARLPEFPFPGSDDVAEQLREYVRTQAAQNAFQVLLNC